MKPGNPWCLVSGRNGMFCPINIWLTQILRFVVIYLRTVRTQTGRRISRFRPATETKSDRSDFVAVALSPLS